MKQMKQMKIDSGIGKGLRYDEFAKLPEITQRKLLKLLARVSESSFRRGLQHGNHFAKTGKPMWISPTDLRFGGRFGLDKSPWVDTKGGGTPSLERLWLEYGDLYELGFASNRDD